MQRESQEETSSTTGKERIPELDKVVVVERSYSRAISRSFPLTQSHSFSPRKSWTFLNKSYETRASLEAAELVQDQIPPSALAPRPAD